MKERTTEVPVSVAAFVPYFPGTTPSQRYRLEQWIPYLAQQGVKVDLFPFADARLQSVLHQPHRFAEKAFGGVRRFVHRFGELAKVKRYDAVVVHRALAVAGPAVLERVLVRLGRPVIFDFDDAIFLLHTTEANRDWGWLKFPGKTATICRLSTHVVVGNEYLSEFARRFNSRVTVIPTSVDTQRYHLSQRRKSNGRIVVGWTGSSTSQTHLEMFAPLLRELTLDDRVEVRVHSDRKPELPGVPFQWRRWLPETEVCEIGDFDIGIMPMPNDEWAKGKCAMKALLYMSLGIPTVCSAVGMNREVIAHGENGLLANSTSEWLGSIKALIDQPGLRQRLGTAGRETVEQRYSMLRSANLFEGVVRGTIEEWNSSGASGRFSKILTV